MLKGVPELTAANISYLSPKQITKSNLLLLQNFENVMIVSPTLLEISLAESEFGMVSNE